MKLVGIGDKLAVSMSLLCTAHCFAAPVLVAVIPSLGSFSLPRDELFHSWMVLAVLPTSILALAMGCRKHRRLAFLVTGFCGLALLAGGHLWGHDLVGEKNERFLTLAGSCLIGLAHIKNYFLCRSLSCEAHDLPCKS